MTTDFTPFRGITRWSIRTPQAPWGISASQDGASQPLPMGLWVAPVYRVAIVRHCLIPYA